MNKMIPLMASTYLPPVGIALFFILVVGSLSSTADSDLSALSAIVMTDVYGKNLARGKPDPRRMLWWGRATMVVATMLRSEEHTSELQSLMRISYAVFCLKKKTNYI